MAKTALDNTQVGALDFYNDASGTLHRVALIRGANRTLGVGRVSVLVSKDATDAAAMAVTEVAQFDTAYITLLSTAILSDSTDRTKQAELSLSGITTGTVRTVTFPDASGTLALTNNKLSAFASTTSAELRGVISDETGTGVAVFNNTPTLITPILGVASATSLACPAFTTSSGAMGFTPAAGSNFNVTLSTTGDFAVGTDLCVDTSASKTGVGTNTPSERLHVLGASTTYLRYETSGSANPAGSYGLTPTTELDSTSFGGYNVTRFGVSSVGYNGVIGVTGGLLLGTFGSTDLIIGTNNTERIRVKNNGYAGAGTSAPATIWNVEGASVSPASLTLANMYTSSPFAVTQATTHYGLYMGADASSGNAWIQVDNAATAYDLLLNPLGGNVVVGHTGTALGRLESRATSGAQIVGSYDASNYASFATSSGGNLTVNVTGSRITLSDTINIPTATPASASATGTAGDLCWDSSYFYVCTASNTWKRVALSTW